MQSQIPRHVPPRRGPDFGNLTFVLIALAVVGLALLVSLFWFAIGLFLG